MVFKFENQLIPRKDALEIENSQYIVMAGKYVPIFATFRH